MEIQGKKFLVVGGAGFIGSHLVEQLAAEGAVLVRVFDNFSRGRMENLTEALALDNVELFPMGGDVLHRDVLDAACKGVDGVFHLAALWLLHCWDFPRSAFEVNIGGSFNVFDACLNNGVPRIVFSSSASVYGDAVEEPMTESHPFNNTNFYGATKVAGEQMLRALHHRWRDTERCFDYAGLRYMNVYGPRQDYQGAYISVIMKILDRLDKGESPVVYGDGTQSYDFVHVRDCARANVAAMRAETTDAFYNVGTGVKTSIRELAEMLADLHGSGLPVQYEPGGMTFVKNRVGSTAMAEMDLGFQARVDLEEGLREVIAWRKAHKQEVEMRRREVGL